MGDWLGPNFIATYNRQYRSFEEAKAFVHSLGLKNSAEWTKYAKSTDKADDIPASPSAVYEDQWKSWGDWLGTSTVAWQDRVYRPFEEAKRYIHAFQFSNRENYAKWCKSGNKPDDIPASPSAVYKDQWKSWGDWLGTDYIIPANSRYRPFEEAREYIHTLHLTKRNEWLEYCRSDKKPIDIPRNPTAVYEDKWISWLDWLGYKKFRDFEEAKKYTHSLALKSYSPVASLLQIWKKA